jgi:phosphoribosylanthranilate isomerase
MVRIKICGITNGEDALLAAGLGAQALGFIFYPPSPRSVEPEAARDIIRRLPPLVLSVGVFVNEPLVTVRNLAGEVGLDWVQLHGEETPGYCREVGRPVVKVIPVADENSLGAMASYQGVVRAFLLDTHKAGQRGGTGRVFDWELAVKAKAYGPIILAGGLNPGNVAEAVGTVRPEAVDVASGVEARPGKKDPAKLRAFFAAISCS